MRLHIMYVIPLCHAPLLTGCGARHVCTGVGRSAMNPAELAGLTRSADVARLLPAELSLLARSKTNRYADAIDALIVM